MFIKKFNLKREEFNTVVKDSINSAHLIEDRASRMENVDVNATVVDGFVAVVDRGHKNGYEIHALFSDGTIRIYNFTSHRFITILFARPGQASRIMDKRLGKELPGDILRICLNNLRSGKNNW